MLEASADKSATTGGGVDDDYSQQNSRKIIKIYTEDESYTTLKQ